MYCTFSIVLFCFKSRILEGGLAAVIRKSNFITGLDRLRGAAGGWGKIVSPTHRQPLLPGDTRVLMSIRRRVDAGGLLCPEGLRQ